MLNEKSIKYIHHTNSLNKYTEIQAKKATKNNKENWQGNQKRNQCAKIRESQLLFYRRVQGK